MNPEQILTASLQAGLMAFKLGEHDVEDTESLLYLALTEKEMALVMVALTMLRREMMLAPEFERDAAEVFSDLIEKIDAIAQMKLGNLT